MLSAPSCCTLATAVLAASLGVARAAAPPVAQDRATRKEAEALETEGDYAAGAAAELWQLPASLDPMFVLYADSAWSRFFVHVVHRDDPTHHLRWPVS